MNGVAPPNTAAIMAPDVVGDPDHGTAGLGPRACTVTDSAVSAWLTTTRPAAHVTQALRLREFTSLISASSFAERSRGRGDGEHPHDDRVLIFDPDIAGSRSRPEEVVAALIGGNPAGAQHVGQAALDMRADEYGHVHADSLRLAAGPPR